MEPQHSARNPHLEAEAAKDSHVRPQDRDLPVEDRLADGETAFFRDHNGHLVRVVVVSPLPHTAKELLGTNLTTKEGRGPHAEESLYEVLDEHGGTTHTVPRYKLFRDPKGEVGTAESVHAGAPVEGGHAAPTASHGAADPKVLVPPHMVESSREEYDGKLGALNTEKKGPRRR